MEDIKFKTGDRVFVKTSYDSSVIELKIGSTGTVMEEGECPWIKFDDESLNYTKRGTAVSQYDLEIIK